MALKEAEEDEEEEEEEAETEESPPTTLNLFNKGTHLATPTVFSKASDSSVSDVKEWRSGVCKNQRKIVGCSKRRLRRSRTSEFWSSLTMRNDDDDDDDDDDAAIRAA